MRVVTDEESTEKMVAPQLIIFLDRKDIDDVKKELEDEEVDITTIEAKPLTVMILNEFNLKLEPYDGKVYYSKAVREFLTENQKTYIGASLAKRKQNARAIKKKLKR